MNEFSKYMELLKNETPNPMDATGYRFKKNILYKPDEKVS